MALTSKAGGRRSPPQEKSGTAKAVEFVGVIVVALALAFVVQLLFVKTYKIPSGSMEPTLDIGQRVLVNRIGMRFGDPGVGDIVVFHPPTGVDSQPTRCGAPDEGNGSSRPCGTAVPGTSDQTFIKRVVGVGGDTIALRGGRVIRNGRPTREPFINPCAADAAGCDFPREITVPDGGFYMLGDNRGASDDSRFWGPITKDQVIGTAFATYWPLDRIGFF